VRNATPTETLPVASGYTWRESPFGLLVAEQVAPPELWLPEPRESAREPVTFGQFFGPYEVSRMLREEVEARMRIREYFSRFMFGGLISERRAQIISPLDGSDDEPGSLGSGWAETLDSIDALPETAE
jgi:hypothetical protein